MIIYKKEPHQSILTRFSLLIYISFYILSNTCYFRAYPQLGAQKLGVQASESLHLCHEVVS